jgi:hypothetical protein
MEFQHIVNLTGMCWSLLLCGQRMSVKEDQTAEMGNHPKEAKTSPVVHAVLISVQFCFSGWHIIGSVALVSASKRFHDDFFLEKRS